MTNPNQPTWLPGTVGPISAGAGGPQGGGFTIPTNPQTCPPGYQNLGGGMCLYCPPAGFGVACQPISLMDAWRQYDATQRSLSLANGATSLSPPPPPFPPPPPPPPGSPPSSPPPYPPPPPPNGGSTNGTVYQTGGGSTAVTTGGQQYGTTQKGLNGSLQCLGPFPNTNAPPPFAVRMGWQAKRDSQGQWWYCPPGANPPNPNPPSPPPSSSPTACPQSYTILQGPPCPQYLAVLGTPDSWRASGFALPSGWTALQTVTDTPDNVQNAVNALISRCVAGSISSRPPTQ